MNVGTQAGSHLLCSVVVELANRALMYNDGNNSPEDMDVLVKNAYQRMLC